MKYIMGQCISNKELWDKLKNLYSIEEIVVAHKDATEIEANSIKDIVQELSNYENDSQVT